MAWYVPCDTVEGRAVIWLTGVHSEGELCYVNTSIDGEKGDNCMILPSRLKLSTIYIFVCHWMPSHAHGCDSQEPNVTHVPWAGVRGEWLCATLKYNMSTIFRCNSHYDTSLMS